jgi:hypothetical protein
VGSNRQWRRRTTSDEVCRRAAGRNHYNSLRTLWKRLRRRKVFELLAKYGLVEHGVVARIAAERSVSRTVCRDLMALVEWTHPCPHGGEPVPPEFVNGVWIEGR